MNEELNTYKMTITVKWDDSPESLRNWVSESIRFGFVTSKEDILDFEIEKIDWQKVKPLVYYTHINKTEQRRCLEYIAKVVQ